MQSASYHITVNQGSHFTLPITWKDQNQVPINLTGFTARMQARRTHDATTHFIELTTENGGITLGGAAGTITLSLSAAATAAISAETGVWDLELISSGGIVTRLIQGEITISKEVTR